MLDILMFMGATTVLCLAFIVCIGIVFCAITLLEYLIGAKL